MGRSFLEYTALNDKDIADLKWRSRRIRLIKNILLVVLIYIACMELFDWYYWGVNGITSQSPRPAWVSWLQIFRVALLIIGVCMYSCDNLFGFVPVAGVLALLLPIMNSEADIDIQLMVILGLAAGAQICVVLISRIQMSLKLVTMKSQRDALLMQEKEWDRLKEMGDGFNGTD